MISIFFFNDTATTEIYTLSLHDALPISSGSAVTRRSPAASNARLSATVVIVDTTRRSFQAQTATRKSSVAVRSEEHTSELQSRQYLVCRLLLEKKKNYLRTLHSVDRSHL